ncbi:hypothetical protein MRX96_037197 [Rhipicephalus microplus]
MAALLRNISADRTLFHHTRTVYDLNSQTTQQVSTDFMGGLSCEARIIYSTEVRLADEVVDLATATRGLRNEPKARKALEQKLQTPILETGLVVLPEQPWLTCNPNGLMRYDGNTVLVEIKCPARCEKVPIIDKAGKTILEFFDCQAGTLTLKKSHSFYTQLQLQLYIMNLSEAVFYAWSPVQDHKFLFCALVFITAKQQAAYSKRICGRARPVCGNELEQRPPGEETALHARGEA